MLLRSLEIFPSASYSQLDGDAQLTVEISFAEFESGPKDMLDAVVAAMTVREWSEGRGDEVGGRDGLGAIILPRSAEDPVRAAVENG